MKGLKFYQVLSYILLPFGALLGLVTLMTLLASGARLPMLIVAFITGSCVIYIFTSFSFLQKGINRQIRVKPSLKDWIKVNGYVAVFFAIVGLMQGIMVLSQPETLKTAIRDLMEAQPSAFKDLKPAQVLQAIKGMLYFLVVFSSLLLIHITSTFRLLRQYKHLYDAEP